MENDDLEKLISVVEVYLKDINEHLAEAKKAELEQVFKRAVQFYYKACYALYDLILIVCNNLFNFYIEECLLVPLENKLVSIANRINYIYVNHMKGILDLKRISDQLYLSKDPMSIDDDNTTTSRKNGDEKDAQRFFTIIKSGESFENIIGHEEVKKDLINVLKIQTSDHVKDLEHVFNLKLSSNAILFSGPPGTGKTSLAAAVANENRSPLYVINVSEILSMFLGEGEKNLKRLFEKIKLLTAESLQVVFFDEIDSLLRERNAQDSDSALRLKNIFMTELDELIKNDKHKCLFIFASNFVQNLDQAFLRRLTKVYTVDKPQTELEYGLHVDKLLQNINAKNEDKKGLCKFAYTKKLSQADLKRVISIAITDKLYNSLQSGSGFLVSKKANPDCYNKINIIGEKIDSDSLCYSLSNEKDYSQVMYETTHILAPELSLLDFNNAYRKITNQ